ncbi:hypothetical protein [Flammeovirga agarivorans]|uniref:Lipoprotein n=1 Tax=Flammeovirga agarivorans TaxID=2726742 RepID=A0A7X8SMG3_9BACT|nr:hypothetical protein [Flammeovirga agarivorans]NLR92949.1 hypothetical protein [Flammeovirga agarivorans]
MRTLLIITLLFLFTTSCTTNEKNEKDTSVNNSSGDYTSTIVNHSIETESGMLFTLTEERVTNSVSNISIQGMNFPNSNDIINIDQTDPIEQFNVMDLNDDGYEELYISQRTPGSGAYVKLIGVSSNRDNSYSKIYVPSVSENDELSEGYMGHDEVEFTRKDIIRTYPVYKEKDSNAHPTGGVRTVKYELITGEAGYILNPYMVSNE